MMSIVRSGAEDLKANMWTILQQRYLIIFQRLKTETKATVVSCSTVTCVTLYQGLFLCETFCEILNYVPHAHAQRYSKDSWGGGIFQQLSCQSEGCWFEAKPCRCDVSFTRNFTSHCLPLSSEVYKCPFDHRASTYNFFL